MVRPSALAVLRLIIEFELRGLLDGYAAPLAALNWSVAKRNSNGGRPPYARGLERDALRHH